MSALQCVMETYAGRPKELIQCEGYLREISQTIRDNYAEKGLKYKTPITRNYEPCKKLESTLEKFFGVSEIAIYWTSGMINAMTITESSTIIATRNNSGDFKSAKFHIIIYDNLVYDCGLTEQELMAVLLHELGHCFYSSNILVIGELLNAILNPISVVLLFLGKGIAKISNKLDDYAINKIPGIYKLLTKWEHFKLELNQILRYTTIIPNPMGIARVASRNISNPLETIGQYGNERGADTFAAKYGYAGEQITALKKLERPENTTANKALNKMGGFGDFVRDYNDVMFSLAGMLILDPHPNNDVRAQTMIRKLERDLQNGDYPPELKSDLQKEIARVKQIHKTINDNKSNVEIKKAWYNMLNALTDGHSNLQEIFNWMYVGNEF